MSKLTRGLVLGAMLAVLSSATAAAAPPQPPLSRNEAVKEFRAGERASTGQPVSRDQAVQRFRAGERASTGQPVSRDDAVQQFRSGERASLQLASDKAAEQALAQQRRAYYESTRPVAAPAQPAPDGQTDTPVALLVVLGVAAALALGLDALSVRRKTRKAAHPAI
jgi:hypothetical protein